MKLNDSEIEELNRLIKKGKLDLPFNKKIVTRHTNVYSWLQKNIQSKNSSRLTPRLAELLDIELSNSTERTTK